MATVLITGVDGFTGKHLSACLTQHGHQVVGTVLGQTESSGLVSCDLTDQGSVREVVGSIRPDYVVHLAGMAFVGHGSVETFYQVNLLGTLHLLQALHETLGSSVRKVLLAGSANIYGNADIEPIDETVTPSPINDYAVSKLAMEYMAGLWFERLPIVIARPFNYTGVGQDERFLLPKIVGHHRRREAVLELGNLDVARDFSDVRDVCEIYRRLLECKERGLTVNVCSGNAYSLREILAMVGELAGYAPQVRVNPAFVRANEVTKLVGSRRRLESVIGPVAGIPLHDTLGWMLAEQD